MNLIWSAEDSHGTTGWAVCLGGVVSQCFQARLCVLLRNGAFFSSQLIYDMGENQHQSYFCAPRSTSSYGLRCMVSLVLGPEQSVTHSGKITATMLYLVDDMCWRLPYLSLQLSARCSPPSGVPCRESRYNQPVYLLLPCQGICPPTSEDSGSLVDDTHHLIHQPAQRCPQRQILPRPGSGQKCSSESIAG